MRRNFLALLWRPGAQVSAAHAHRLIAAAADRPDWSLALARPGLRLWTQGPADLPVAAPGPALVLVGEAFPSGAPWATGGDPDAQARAVSRAWWGAFLALLTDPHGRTWIYRDPTGMIDALTWSLGDDVAVVASNLLPLPPGFGPRRLGLDWDRIAAFVASPTTATTDALFSGVQAVGPGELTPAGGGPPRTIWSPLDHVAPSGATASALQAAFVQQLDQCVDRLIGGHARVVFELSGGLDSSSLAAAVAATGHADRVVQWRNHGHARPEADEAVYARAVTDRLGVRLTVDRRPLVSLGEADLAELGPQMWPAFAGVDVARDRRERQAVETLRASAILSGQGGDAIFFQMPSPLVVADAWLAQGWRGLFSPLPAQVARRVRGSVWSVLAEARRAIRRRESGPKLMNLLLSPEAIAAVGGLDHAWVRAARTAGVPPGKAFQVRALATSHANHGTSRRRDAADLIYPFLAQPMMELALSVPTPVLAGGNHARPFQREAFADRLPALVRDRRAKGNVSVYVAQLVAGSLAVLRPYLLDGCLAAAGVLDRRRLAEVLDAEFLIRTAAGDDVMVAAAVEAWVRYWQRQAPDAATARRWR